MDREEHDESIIYTVGNVAPYQRTDLNQPEPSETFEVYFDQIVSIFMDAFNNSLYKSIFTYQTASEYIKPHLRKPGNFIFTEFNSNGLVVGVLWGDTPSYSELEKEWKRGDELVQISRKILAEHNIHKYNDNDVRGSIIWFRDICVRPSYQGRNIGKRLLQRFNSYLELKSSQGKPTLVLARMKDNNNRILKITSKIGFLPLGIKTSLPRTPNIFDNDYYWKLYM